MLPVPVLCDAGDFVVWSMIAATLGLLGVRVMLMFLGGIWSD